MATPLVPTLDHPQCFVLDRAEDATGISGTGVVAWGVRFPDGTCVLRWAVGEHRSTGLYGSLADVENIHGHEGRTRVVWDPCP